MPIYAEYNDQNIVFAVTESAQAPVGNFIEADSFDVIGWVKNGDTIKPTPVAQQYKTVGLDQTQYRSLFTITEQLRNDECEAFINDPTYDTVGGVNSLDDDAAAVGMAGATYRALMRSGYRGFNASTISGINVAHPTVQLSVACQARLGLLDSPERAPVILLGLSL